MPLWVWIALVAGAVLFAAVVLAIWFYPRDNSF